MIHAGETPAAGLDAVFGRLTAIPSLQVSRNTPLARYTRFAIGGPADLFAETRDAEAFFVALHVVRASGLDLEVIGGGTNLIVSDDGFRGVVLRFVGDRLTSDGNCVLVEAGAVL